ncbi:MAG: hypothetical protein HQL31_03010, partial [Planctomycetes bacterium]|nr:hypothetical protein [Planctomycetota bacterium]
MPLRVSNLSYYSSFSREIQNSFSKLTGLQNQLTTMKQFERPSESPILALRAIHTERNIRELGQFGKNVDRGSSLLTYSDQVLSNVHEMMNRAITLAQQGNNATQDSSGREA